MKKKAHVIVFMAVIVLALAIWGIGQNWRGKEKLLRTSFNNLLTAQTLHAKAALNLRLPERLRDSERPFTQILLQIEGDVAPAVDARSPEATGQLLIEARGRGNIFFADGEIRILQDEVLFNLENLPVFLNPSGSLVKKWTRVAIPTLQTKNEEAVKTALASVGNGVSYIGKETIDGKSLLHYQGALSSEQQQGLIAVMRQSESDNRALGVLARLLQANTVKSLDIWVDGPAEDIRRIKVHFVRPLADGGEYDFATLNFDLTDYGKDVAIDRPNALLSVRPEVFGRIFGNGELAAIQSE